LRVNAQATDFALRALGKTLQLADGVEDDLVAIVEHLLDLIVSPGHAVGVGFAFELLTTELELVQRRRRGAVHVLLHQVEHRPGREALEREQGFGPGLFAHISDLLHVGQQFLFVDEVVRCLDHFEASGKASQKRMRIVPGLTTYRKSRAYDWFSKYPESLNARDVRPGYNVCFKQSAIPRTR
jgi:hypothetical protein